MPVEIIVDPQGSASGRQRPFLDLENSHFDINEQNANNVIRLRPHKFYQISIHTCRFLKNIVLEFNSKIRNSNKNVWMRPEPRSITQQHLYPKI